MTDTPLPIALIIGSAVLADSAPDFAANLCLGLFALGFAYLLLTSVREHWNK